MKRIRFLIIISFTLLLTGCSLFSGSKKKTNNVSTTTKKTVYEDDYFIYDEGSVKAKNDKISGNLVIPESYNNIPVTTISKDAFKNCINITSIVVPNSVTTIEMGSFSGCIGLESITLPFTGVSRDKNADGSHFGRIFGSDSYTGGIAIKQYKSNSVVPDYCTYYIPSTLKKVTITDAYKLGYGAFDNCSMLTEINLNEGIKSLNESVFAHCTGLKTISLPNVNAISRGCFYGCSNLEEFNIGENVEEIGENAFYGCTKLLRINSENDGEYVIPKTVNTIGMGAFSGCFKVKSIVLPFAGTSRAKENDGSHFGRIFGKSSYTNSQATKQAYNTGTILGESTETYYIPMGLTNVTITDADLIGYGAFNNCTMIEKLYINERAKNDIRTKAFKNCVEPTWTEEEMQ